eukprot:scaffold20461_cov117-Cylindrotheca_fusiformis.AAC.12
MLEKKSGKDLMDRTLRCHFENSMEGKSILPKAYRRASNRIADGEQFSGELQAVNKLFSDQLLQQLFRQHHHLYQNVLSREHGSKRTGFVALIHRFNVTAEPGA